MERARFNTCSMVNASAKQQTGKRIESTAKKRSGFFTAARLYLPEGTPSNSIQALRFLRLSSFLILTSYFLLVLVASAPPCELIFFSFEESLVNCETPGHTRQLSAGKQRRKNYDSFNLVHCCWVDRGGYREVCDARAHDDFLDNHARHHRIDHRRRGYPHVFAPHNRTISSRRPHFFYTGRDPGPLRLS